MSEIVCALQLASTSTAHDDRANTRLSLGAYPPIRLNLTVTFFISRVTIFCLYISCFFADSAFVAVDRNECIYNSQIITLHTLVTLTFQRIGMPSASMHVFQFWGLRPRWTFMDQTLSLVLDYQVLPTYLFLIIRYFCFQRYYWLDTYGKESKYLWFSEMYIYIYFLRLSF